MADGDTDQARPATTRPAPPQQAPATNAKPKPTTTRVRKKKPRRKLFENIANRSGTPPVPRLVSEDTVAGTLDERGREYGDFMSNSVIIQNVKLAMRDSRGGFFVLEPDAKQSLDEIATKIGRIVCGNNSNIDHWRDIEGYARLVRERLEREAKNAKRSDKR